MPSRISIMNATWRTCKHKKCVTAILGLTVIMAMMQQQLPSTGRQLSASPSGSRTRPVIHTFFHSLPKEEQEDAVLQLWKDEWYRAGFDPVVLDIGDAKKNPYFSEVQEIIHNLKTPLNGYNALCFYRWLAMAASGGGWMSDHDTYPTNIRPLDMAQLPRMGAFTSFEQHIPSLMAGTAEEWDRVSRLLIATIPDIPLEMPVSDMYALMVLKEEGRGKNGIWFAPVTRPWVTQGVRYKSPGIVGCNSMKVGKVVHMSHHVVHQAVKQGIFPIIREKDPYGKLFRGEGVKLFLEQWREQCFPVVDEKKAVNQRSLLKEYVSKFKTERTKDLILPSKSGNKGIYFAQQA